ncbi:hypothetical protein NQ315_006759 [Exocentrus adspersus]|uniref:Uncharacterized protein n=1 Tax=Exocentrus adspersus TaxID=1586481 RepID=A0AAV8WBN8_9CUCU|nr:hypothetical protein NQ315_006759 [Exocentrus adspersus]
MENKAFIETQGYGHWLSNDRQVGGVTLLILYSCDNAVPENTASSVFSDYNILLVLFFEGHFKKPGHIFWAISKVGYLVNGTAMPESRKMPPSRQGGARTGEDPSKRLHLGTESSGHRGIAASGGGSFGLGTLLRHLYETSRHTEMGIVMEKTVQEVVEQDLQEEGQFVVDDVSKIIKDAIETVIGGNGYQQNKVNNWTTAVVEACTAELTKLMKPYKYIVTCTIMQKNGAGLHTASSCYWDNNTDGSCTIASSNSYLHYNTAVVTFEYMYPVKVKYVK